MKITTIGRGHIGGTLARLWTAAGHEVTTLGRDGGDASGSNAVLLAVPAGAVADALSRTSGLKGATVLDATNRFGADPGPADYPSIAEFVKAHTGGPTAKAFSLNFAVLLDQAATTSPSPSNVWVGDEEARPVVEQLSTDIGFQPLNAGPLAAAAAQEAFGEMIIAIMKDAGVGPIFSWFGAPTQSH